MHRNSRTSPRDIYPAGLKNIRYTEHGIPKPFIEFATSRILSLVTLDGYKLAEKQRVAIQCIHNLSLAALRNPPRVVSDSRDNSWNGLRIAVWNALIEAGLCRIWSKGIEGIPGQIQGYVTQYRARRTLLDLLKLYRQGRYIDYKLDWNTRRKKPTESAHVVLHTGRTDLRTVSRIG